MKKPNNVVVEQGVPKSDETIERIFGFFGCIGWSVYVDSEYQDLIYVSPSQESPTVCYWQTTNQERVGGFVQRKRPSPSRFSVGMSLPKGFRYSETGLIVKDDLVEEVWDKGGSLLAAHAYRSIKEYCGTYDIRFADPFGFGIRVTGDPGYEF